MGNLDGTEHVLTIADLLPGLFDASQMERAR
jgi:hypothetical protein